MQNEISFGLWLTISILAPSVAVVAAAFTITNNRKVIRNTSRQEHVRLFIEVDKQMLNDPELWAIYDGHEICKTFTDNVIKKAKRKTFIFLILNCHDCIFDFYNNTIWKSKTDKLYWEHWDRLLKQFFFSSTEVREVATYAIKTKIYHEKFVQYMQSILDEYSGVITK